MWYEEKHMGEIQQSITRLFNKMGEGDIGGSEMERDTLMELYRMELRWIIRQCMENKIRKRKG
jgi:hypothetical protein